VTNFGDGVRVRGRERHSSLFMDRGSREFCINRVGGGDNREEFMGIIGNSTRELGDTLSTNVTNKTMENTSSHLIPYLLLACFARVKYGKRTAS
jgi:hypothetical protein